MKKRNLEGSVSIGTISLFMTMLVLGLLSSNSQTARLGEQELIDELLIKGVLEVHSDDSDHYRFLDPILTKMAIDTAVAGSRYESAWEMNHELNLSDTINVITINSDEWDFEATGPICIFRKNAVYLPSLETIVVDVQAARAIANETDEPEAYIGAVMAWIIGHEIGHAVLQHGRRTFFEFDELGCEASTVTRLDRLFSSCLLRCKDRQEIELVADRYFATQIMEISNGSEVMIGFLLPLLSSIYDDQGFPNYGKGTHPSHTTRAVKLLDEFVCDNKMDEEFRNELAELLVTLSGEPEGGVRMCSEENSTQ